MSSLPEAKTQEKMLKEIKQIKCSYIYVYIFLTYFYFSKESVATFSSPVLLSSSTLQKRCTE